MYKPDIKRIILEIKKNNIRGVISELKRLKAKYRFVDISSEDCIKQAIYYLETKGYYVDFYRMTIIHVEDTLRLYINNYDINGLKDIMSKIIDRIGEFDSNLIDQSIRLINIELQREGCNYV